MKSRGGKLSTENDSQKQMACYIAGPGLGPLRKALSNPCSSCGDRWCGCVSQKTEAERSMTHPRSSDGTTLWVQTLRY